MATTVAELVARLTADVSGFKRGMAEADAALGRNAQSLKSLGANMQDFGKKLTIGVTLPIAAAGVAAFRELESAGKVAAQTTAVIKSTGGAANVTAGQVDKMGTSLSRMSGIDDELIKSGTNLILTFRNVHNELGRGNAIVDRATKAALDLSVAGFGDMTSTSKMLGKALNDPIAGLTAMSRAGVTFTASQKDAIKAMVESGDLLGAQKKILKEVELQVGGSAKAYGQTLAGQVGRAKEALLNSAAAIMGTAAPAIQFIANVATKFAGVLESLPGPVKGVVGGLLGVAAVAGPLIYVVGGLARNFAALQETAGGAKLIGGVKSLGSSLAGFLSVAAGAAVIFTVGSAIRSVARHTYDAAKGMQELARASDRAIMNDAWKHFVENAFRNGVSVSKSFREIAMSSEETAQRIILSMQEAGQPTKEFERILGDVRRENDRVANSASNVANGLVDQGRAAELTKTQIALLRDESTALANSQLGVHGALLNVEAAQQAYNDTLKDNAPDSLAARQAALDMGEAVMNAGAQVYTATEKSHGHKAAIQAQIDTLKFLSGNLTGPARAAVWGYIADLEALNGKNAKPTIDADTSNFWTRFREVQTGLGRIANSGANAAINGMLGKVWLGAKGGVVTRATPSIIGEAGPEAVIPLSDPRRGAEVMRQAGLTGGGGGGTTVVVNITAPVGADRAAIGREIQELIDAYGLRRGSLN